MPVIKSANAPASATPYSMRDIEQQAAALLARAAKQANAVLIQAQRAAEKLKSDAIVEGLAEGRREGLELGKEEGRQAGREEALDEQREQLTALAGALGAGLEEFNHRRREFEAGVLREVAELAVKVAGRITKRHGQLDPLVLEGNLGESLKLVVGAHKLRVEIHPTQKSVLGDALPRLRLQFPALEHVELVADDSIAPGGCRVLTRQGLVDATLDEQLNRVAMDLFPGEA